MEGKQKNMKMVDRFTNEPVHLTTYSVSRYSSGYGWTINGNDIEELKQMDDLCREVFGDLDGYNGPKPKREGIVRKRYRY